MLGHEWAVNLLREHVAQGGFCHAYLFTGPQGVGRRTLALRFAQALNCPHPHASGVPCRTCRTCTQIERMQHPDLTVVQAERVGGILRVDQVRDLLPGLSLAPYQARYRIALFLRFEEANPNAANALLKTLEEPPERVILILTAESAESLLPTIVSRCEMLRLRSLSLDTLCAGLQERWGIPEQEARLLAHLSNGRIGYALSLHRDPEQMELRKLWLEEHQNLLSSSRVKRFAYAETLAKDKERLLQALAVWQSLWRDVFLRASGSSVAVSNLDWIDKIDIMASSLGSDTAMGMVGFIQRILGLLEKNINPRLATDVLMLQLPYFRPPLSKD
jgi:DNA polymerase-3 subunit delta'